MSQPTSIKFGRTKKGFIARVEGRGTLEQSPCFDAFVTKTLDDNPSAGVVLDLADCEYLDSTFLGCLLKLHKRYGADQRFVVAASLETRNRLLSATHLDRVLNVTDSNPSCRSRCSAPRSYPLQPELGPPR